MEWWWCTNCIAKLYPVANCGTVSPTSYTIKDLLHDSYPYPEIFGSNNFLYRKEVDEKLSTLEPGLDLASNKGSETLQFSMDFIADSSSYSHESVNNHHDILSNRKLLQQQQLQQQLGTSDDGQQMVSARGGNGPPAEGPGGVVFTGPEVPMLPKLPHVTAANDGGGQATGNVDTPWWVHFVAECSLALPTTLICCGGAHYSIQ